MKNKFLSKSVPRGTRTIWRYLGALFLLFTFAIGNVWAVDYNLINDNDNASTATLNTDDFWTAQSLQAKSNGGDLKKCIIFGGNISAGITNVSYPSRYISYGVKTTSVTITIKAYQSNNSAKKINIYEVNEAANGALTITNTKEESVSKGLQTITFTASPAAGTRSTIYITSQAASNFEFYQVTASETGTALTNLIGGRVGYAIDYSKKSRLATKSGENAMLDGILYYHLSSDYKPNNGTSVQLKTGNYIKFNTIEPVLLTVETGSANKFYVAKTADGTTNEKAATATHKIKLNDASDWYIVGGASSATQIKSIAFDALYTLTYAAGTGSGTMDADYGYLGEEVTLPACTFTAPASSEFNGWVVTKTESGDAVTVTKDGEDYKFTMPAEAVTVTAQWAAATTKFDVTFDSDGGTAVATQKVPEGETASEPSAPTKDCYTFAGWYNGASPFDFSTKITEDVALTAHWTPNYFTESVDFEESGESAVSGVASKNIVASNAGSYDGGKESENWAYKGWKIKSNGATVKVLVQAGKKLTFKFGYLAATAHVAISGDATNYSVTGASKVQDDPLKYTTYSWTKDYDALYTFTTGSGEAAVIKALTVQDTYTATRVDSKSDGAGSDANVLETTLPTPTAVSSWTFTGWIANQDVKAGEDTKTAGTVLAAGTYTLLENTTFTAQWAEASSTYDITYVSAHGTAPAADNAASVVLAELDAEGWAHKGWTANVDVTVDAATVEAGALIANGKTVILASNVTFTAVWKEIFTVTFNSKGGSAVDPIDVEDGASIAAAPADPTKDDYVFQGWSETDGGDVVADITAITISDDKTFYAKWKLDVQVSEIVFSNSFKGWIVGSTVTVFYMSGESAPTIASYAGKNLKAEGGVVISGDKIIATATDDSELEFDLTMTEVTPLATTGAQTFEGAEGYIKTRHAWTSDRKWKMSKYATDGRVARGETSMYIFLGAAESVTLDWGAQKVTNDVAVYVNGTFVKNIGKNNNSAIPLTGGNNMVALYSLQTSGDIWLDGLSVVAYVPTSGVALQEGDDPISSKTIWEGENFTLTAVVTPDNASDKTITWTSSNEAVATVENGVVTGVAANASPVTITATTVDGVYATCEVTVTTAPTPSAAPTITTQPASDNYYEGATIAALEVVATGSGDLSYQWYLGSDEIDGATAPTYTPTVSAIGSYVYHCVVTNTETGHLPTSLASNNATITIAEDPAAIKLFDGEGNLNTTNFISPEKTTIEISEVEYTCLKEFSSNRSSLGGATPTDMVKYDVTTDKAMIQMTFYNNNSGVKKAILYKYEEGGTPEKIEIEVPGQEIFTTEYYEFNSSKNRTFYVCMNDRSNIRVLQVKVIDNGANPVKQFGQVGYSLNLNKARFYAKAAVEKSFEGFTFTPSSDYKVYNNSNLATTSANSFTIASPTVMSVKRSGGKYYVYQDPADKGTLYSADAEIELNTTGTWYISSETTSSAASFTKIEFLAPKCEKPVFGTMSDIDLCAGDAFTDIDGTATVSDGGVVSYKWYKEGSETVLGTAATYTPSADGNYYVVATNSLADHQDNSATSDVVTVEHFDAAAIVTAPEDIATQAGQEKTLTIVASGANLQYVWYTCDDAEGTNPVAIVPAQTTASLTVTVPDGVQYYKVAVTDDCGADLSAVVKVEGWTDLPQVDVTESTVWDMTNVSANAINLASMTPSKQNVRLLLANIEGVNNNASFNSQALMFEGQHIGRTSNNVKHLAGQYVQFNVTVPGMVSVTFASNGSAQRTIQINGKQCSRTTNDGTYIKYDVAVEPGSVEIEDVQGYVRISKIEFKAEYNYHRENLNPNNIGTLCWTNNAVLGGATLYELVGKNEYNKLVFEEVDENRLEAGKPYIFVPENGNTEIRVYNTDTEDALTQNDLQAVNGMHGTFVNLSTIDDGENSPLWNKYIITNNHYVYVDYANCRLGAYRAYITSLDDVAPANPEPSQNQNGAPRRRIVMGAQSEQVATGCENLNVSDKPVKMIINGQLFILRGEKMYDAKGQLVK